MAKLFKGGLADWIRGSQSIIHEWRMLGQSVLYTLMVSAGVVFLTTAYFAWAGMTVQERHGLRVYAQAGFNIAILSDPTKLVTYKEETGQTWMIRSDKFTQSRIARQSKEAMLDGAWTGFCWGASAMLFIILALVTFFYVAGRDQSSEKFVRGARLADRKQLAKSLRKIKGGAGVLAVNGLSIPRRYEPQHFMFLGASGTGKTQIYMRLLEGVRAAGQKAIVYDINGTFVEKFYSPKSDTILNPLDARSAPWDLWSEVNANTDYDRLAVSLFPDSVHAEPFWTQAARAVFAAVAQKMMEEAKALDKAPSNREFYELLALAPINKLVTYCRNTPAGAFLDKDSEKMTASVRATLATAMKGFGLLRDADSTFSIREFITDEKNKGWLFITSKNDQLAALKGLITLWVDTAVATLLSMDENPDRRIWFSIDEMPSLNKLEALLQMMAQARKYGGAAALGLQSFAQLVEIYGREGAEAITGSCSIWFLLRPNDPMTAKWCSESLGKIEREEAQEGVSVGRHEMRDGRTLQKQRIERPVVLPSELRNLRDMEFYLSLGRGLPIAKGEMKYRQFEKAAAPFKLAENLPDPNKPQPLRLEKPRGPNSEEVQDGAIDQSEEEAKTSENGKPADASPTSSPETEEEGVKIPEEEAEKQKKAAGSKKKTADPPGDDQNEGHQEFHSGLSANDRGFGEWKPSGWMDDFKQRSADETSGAGKGV